MNSFTLHTIFQKISILFFAFSFVFVSVYVPQPVNKVPTAEAAFSTAANQVSQEAVALLQLAKDAIIATSIFALETKEYFLDGLLWAAARLILSQMTADIVNWINRGFEGSPMYVQDLRRYLTDVSDVLIGSYLQELGGIASIVCAPFQLDIQLALNFAYTAARRGALYGSCTLSGAMANINNFFTGTGAFFDGGWDAWYGVSSRPQIYTPYGTLLTVEGQAGVRLINTRNEEFGYLGFGQGFLSSKTCQQVTDAAGSREECVVNTPGIAIEKALTFQLSSGARSLIAADEIDEIVGALLAQIAVQALDGTAGLLGLTSDSGYTQPLVEADIENEEDLGLVGETFADGQVAEQQAISGRLLQRNLERELDEFVQIETDFLVLLAEYEPAIQAACGIGEDAYGIENLTTNPVLYACETLPVIDTIQTEAEDNLALIDEIRTALEDAINDGIDIDVIMEQYAILIEPLHTRDELQAAENEGEAIIMALIDPYLELEQKYLSSLEILYASALEKCFADLEEELRLTTIPIVKDNIQALQNLRLTVADRGEQTLENRGPETAVNAFIEMLPDGGGDNGVLHSLEDIAETEEINGQLLAAADEC